MSRENKPNAGAGSNLADGKSVLSNPAPVRTISFAPSPVSTSPTVIGLRAGVGAFINHIIGVVKWKRR